MEYLNGPVIIAALSVIGCIAFFCLRNVKQ